MPEAVQLPRVELRGRRASRRCWSSRASARSMLSPPSRMCSPTATRSSVRSPSRSPTAIRLKSVVPPPTSQTSTRSPTLHLPAPRVAERVEPGVERGLRLFEQRHVLEAGALRGAQRQLARLRVERRGHRQQDVLLRQRQRRRRPARPRVERRGEVPQVRGRRVHRRDLRHVLGRAPRQDRRGAVRAAVRQPRLRRRDQPHRVLGAAAPRELADDESRRAGPTAARGCRRGNPARPASRGTTAAACAPRPRRGSRAAGSSCRRTPRCLARRRVSTQPSAQLVVPRSMPTMKRWATRVPFRRLRLRRGRRPCGRWRAAAAGRAASPPSRDAAACRGTAARRRRCRPP